jgi:hypothetical protein
VFGVWGVLGLPEGLVWCWIVVLVVVGVAFSSCLVMDGTDGVNGLGDGGGGGARGRRRLPRVNRPLYVPPVLPVDGSLEMFRMVDRWRGRGGNARLLAMVVSPGRHGGAVWRRLAEIMQCEDDAVQVLVQMREAVMRAVDVEGASCCLVVQRNVTHRYNGVKIKVARFYRNRYASLIVVGGGECFWFGLHRLVKWMHEGPPAQSSLHAHHLCENPRCVAPGHLRWCTGEENLRLMSPLRRAGLSLVRRGAALRRVRGDGGRF